MFFWNSHRMPALLAVYALYSTLAVMTDAQWTAMVNVTVCNAFPGSDLVSVTWGGVTSPKVPYQSCATVLFSNATTTGTATLLSSAGSVLQSANVAMLHNQELCADGNRNQLIAYEDADGSLAADFPLPVGCTPLYVGQAELLFYNADCALSAKAVDFWLVTGSTNEKVGSSLPCGTASDLAVPAGGSNGAIASAFSSRTTGSFSLVAYVNGTKTTVAGPFDLSSIPSPNEDGTVIIVVSGDADHSPSAWASSVNEPAPPGSMLNPPASGAAGISPSWALVSGFVVIGASALLNHFV